MLRSSLLALRSPAFKAAQQTPLRRLAVGPSARVGALAKAFATTRPARQDELDLYSSPYDSFGSQVAVQRVRLEGLLPLFIPTLV
jgi:ABC-type amino acid transport substrate-binding protein